MLQNIAQFLAKGMICAQSNVPIFRNQRPRDYPWITVQGINRPAAREGLEQSASQAAIFGSLGLSNLTRRTNFMRPGLSGLRLSLCTLIATATVFASSAFAAAKAETFTGVVSDAMCGAKHMMEGDCTRACVRKGSKYALIVGDKVYTLDTNNQATLGQLDKLADQKAQIKGQANGETIEVSSVAAAK
jgi:hypothetical protein